MNWKKLFSYGLFVVSIFSLLAVSSLVAENKQLKGELARYQSTYLYQSGATTYQGDLVSYQIASFDGGLNWYSVEYQKDWGVKIIGPVDEDLLKSIMADNRLFEYVSQNGPIDPSDPEGMKILQDAGITVEKDGK